MGRKKIKIQPIKDDRNRQVKRKINKENDNKILTKKKKNRLHF